MGSQIQFASRFPPRHIEASRPRSIEVMIYSNWRWVGGCIAVALEPFGRIRVIFGALRDHELTFRV